MEISENVLKWIATGERGLSSETIVKKLAGIDLVQGRDSEPWDPDDFRRCLLLLDAVPEFRSRLDEMKSVSKYWNALIENWDVLETLYYEEAPTGTAPKLYDKMLELRHESV